MKQGGRFSKLDLRSEVGGPALCEEQERWPDLDEGRCMTLADGHFHSGAYEQALNLYSRALRFSRDLAPAWVGQIRCLLCLGEYPEAVTWSERALERFAKSPELLACKGLALILVGEAAQGIEYLDGAVQLRSPSAWVWIARGHGLLMAGQPFANARHCFLKAEELSPGWTTRLSIGMALCHGERWREAYHMLTQALREAQRNVLVLYYLGLAQEGLGQKQVAAGFFERALAEAPRFSEAAVALERVQARGLQKLWRALVPGR